MSILTLTLTNDFHGADVTLRAKSTPRPGVWELSPAQVRRAERVLCGIDGCTCGGYAGERGGQSHHIEPRGDGGAWIYRHQWDVEV